MADEVWIIEVRDGEYADIERHPVARRSLEGAQRWCNENRKLEGGDPIRWHPLCKSEARVEGTCLVPYADDHSRKKKFRRWYTVQRMAVED